MGSIAPRRSEQQKIRVRYSAGGRFADLALLDEQIFHTDDLANLWNIRNKNTLHMTLARYVATGLLHRIHNGLYTIKPVSYLDSYLIGIKALHRPSYVSCESVLFDNGIINQLPMEITLVSSISKRFIVATQRYRSRKLADLFLFNEIGIKIHNGVRIASVSRAIADMFYFNPKKYLDVTSSVFVDWNAVQEITRQLGYPTKTFKRYDGAPK